MVTDIDPSIKPDQLAMTEQAAKNQTSVQAQVPLQSPAIKSPTDVWKPHQRPGVLSSATLGSAFEALQANPTRSFLTMLGVIIGVSAVIAIVILTQGVNLSVSQRLASLGTNLLTISPGASSSGGGVRSAAGTSQTLTLDDANAVSQVNHVVAMSPILSVSGQVIYHDLNWNTSIRGVYPAYQSIQNWQLADGSWFTDADEQNSKAVAVIGQSVDTNLFPSTVLEPVGQQIRVDGQVFTVVGVLQAKGTQGPSNADDVIFVPFSAASVRLKPTQYVDQIQAQIDDVSSVNQAQIDITSVLRSRHHLAGPDPSQAQTGANRTGSSLGSSLTGGGGGARGAGGGGGGVGGGRAGGTGQGAGSSGARSGRGYTGVSVPNDFQVFNQNQLIQNAQQSSSELTLLLIGIASISLTVGGIGIMNIMLVSVTERIREIGLRMAVGARQRDIRNQFLLEALTLSMIGGLIGIVLGLGAGFLLTLSFSLPYTLSFLPVVIAFVVSATVGIFFGLYPAINASKMDPIVALRSAV